MNDSKGWLLMTYYCPVHGSEDRCELFEVSRNELLKAKKISIKKNNSYKLRHKS